LGYLQGFGWHQLLGTAIEDIVLSMESGWHWENQPKESKPIQTARIDTEIQGSHND
jgi:hypothetical protein